MSISPAQCKMLMGRYRLIRGRALGYNSSLKSSVGMMDSAVGNVTDDDLDDAVVDLAGVDAIPANIDTTSVTNDLVGALITCPALIYVVPQDVISKVNAGGLNVPLPLKEGAKYTKELVSGVTTDVSGAVPGNTDTALKSYRAANKAIKKANMGSLLSELNTLEECLETSCGAITGGERVHNNIVSNLGLDGNTYSISETALASRTGRDTTKLTDTFSSYKSKYGKYF